MSTSSACLVLPWGSTLCPPCFPSLLSRWPRPPLPSQCDFFSPSPVKISPEESEGLTHTKKWMREKACVCADSGPLRSSALETLSYLGMLCFLLWDCGFQLRVRGTAGASRRVCRGIHHTHSQEGRAGGRQGVRVCVMGCPWGVSGRGRGHT